MALHLNFYHEIQKDAQVRARDPIKLAGLAAAAVAILLLGYYFYRSMAVSRVESARRSMVSEWEKTEPKLKAAVAREKELVALQSRNATLMKRLDGRFYWAPLLQHIAEVTPEEVQLTSLSGNLAHPRVTLVLAGLAAGQQPRLVAEQFRAGIEERLQSLYAGSRVSFDGNSLEETGRQVDLGGKALPVARFTLRATFETTPAETPEKEEKAK